MAEVKFDITDEQVQDVVNAAVRDGPDALVHELREKLTERGIEYAESQDRFRTRFRFNYCEACGDYLDEIEVMGVCITASKSHLTPEQAIAATIGHDGQTCRNEWAEFGKFRCSECWVQVDAISTNTTKPMPIRYCPNCGREVER